MERNNLIITAIFVLGTITGLSLFALIDTYSEIPTPSNEFSEDDIYSYNDDICIRANGKDLNYGFYASTGSMSPTISHNMIGIKIMNPTKKELEVGDIVSYKNDGKHRTHRIYGFESDGTIRIKADNGYEYEFINYDQITSKLVGVIY